MDDTQTDAKARRFRIDTLNSVGTMSLGVLSPINISRPTKVMIDMKMEKSLISFLSCSPTHTKCQTYRKQTDIQTDRQTDNSIKQRLRKKETHRKGRK